MPAKAKAARIPNDKKITVTKTVVIPDLQPTDKVICATADVMGQYLIWFNAKQERKTAEATEKAKTAYLKEFMQEATVLLDMTGTRMLATYREHPVPTFNEKKFAADHPKLYAKYVEDAKQRPLKAK